MAEMHRFQLLKTLFKFINLEKKVYSNIKHYFLNNLILVAMSLF